MCFLVNDLSYYCTKQSMCSFLLMTSKWDLTICPIVFLSFILCNERKIILMFCMIIFKMWQVEPSYSMHFYRLTPGPECPYSRVFSLTWGKILMVFFSSPPPLVLVSILKKVCIEYWENGSFFQERTTAFFLFGLKFIHCGGPEP